MNNFLHSLRLKIFQNNLSFGNTFFILLLVPLSILTVLYSYTIPRLLEIEQNNIVHKLDYHLDKAISYSTPYYYVYKRFEYFIHFVKKYGYKNAKTYKLYKILANHHYLPFKVLIYKNREFVKAFPSNNSVPLEFKSLFKDLYYEGKDYIEVQKKYYDILHNYFGPGNRLEVLKERIGKLYRFTLPRKSAEGYYLLEEIENLGFFFYIEKLPKYTIIVKNIHNKIVNNVGLLDFSRKFYLIPKNTQINEFLIAYNKFINENKPHFIYNNKIWLFTKTNKSIIWCINYSTHHLRIYEHKLYLILWVLIIFCISTALLYVITRLKLEYANYILDILNKLNIQNQMTIIFSLSTLVPLFISAVIGKIGLTDKRQIILENIKPQLYSNISSFENIFNKIIVDFHKTSTFLRNSNIIKELDLPKIDKLVKEFKKQNKIQRIEIRDEKGNLLYTTDHRDIHGTLQATDVFSKIAIKRYASNRLLSKEEKFSPDILIAEDYLNQDDVGVTSLLRQYKKVITFKLGTSPALWYWDVYPEISSGPCFISVTHQLEILFEHYMRNLFTNNNNLNQNIIVVTISEISTTFKTFPPLPPNMNVSLLYYATIRARETNQLIFRELELINKQKYWILIKPEQVMNIYSFVSLTPVSKNILPIIQNNRQILFIVMLAIIIAYLASTLITHLFLHPLNDLKKGIKAIKKRDINYKVPIRRNDELGNLAQLFNQVISELKELEYGKIVQDRLLPTETPNLLGWDISVCRIPATDLAGDYHDIIKLPNSPYLIIIIGDATGHGIPAALIMAMAKASITFQILDNWKFPEQTMENLNALFYKELKPKFKFMTLCYLVINVETGECIIDNAGHPYPLIINCLTCQTRFVSLPSLPLGARKVRNSKPYRFILDVNEAIILYTDGVTECIDNNNEPFGYKKFENTILSTVQKYKNLLTTKYIISETITALLKHCKNSEINYHSNNQVSLNFESINFQDDLTIIAIIRNNKII